MIMQLCTMLQRARVLLVASLWFVATGSYAQPVGSPFTSVRQLSATDTASLNQALSEANRLQTTTFANISLAAGAYTADGAFNITRAGIQITGAGASSTTFLCGRSTGTAVQVSAGWTRLAALRVSGCSSTAMVMVAPGAGRTELEGVVFSGNSQGLGVLGPAAELHLTSCTFEGHTLSGQSPQACPSCGSGGAAAYISWVSLVNITGCTFKNNSALLNPGGALYLEAVQTAVHISTSNLTSNTASSGGAIYSRSCNMSMGPAVSFLQNSALSGGALVMQGGGGSMRSCILAGNTAALTAAINSSLPGGRSSAASLAATACGLGGGGALCAACDEDLQVVDTTFTANQAAFGGALYVSSSPLCASRNGCYRLSLTGSTALTSNTAVGGAGGGLYWLYSDTLSITCPSGTTTNAVEPSARFNASRLPRPQPPAASLPCASWTGNVAVGSAYGPVVASSPFQLVAVPPVFLNYNDNTNINSVQRGIRVNVSLHDAYGQLVSSTMLDPAVMGAAQSSAPGSSSSAGITITARNSKAYGETVVVTAAGVANFTNLQLRAPEGNQTVDFIGSTAVRPLTSASSLITVRGCRIGEALGPTLDFCYSCDALYYNFNTSSTTCEYCPKFAHCAEKPPSDKAWGGQIVPDMGYWHSNAWSEQIHECVNPDACTYTGRGKRLGGMQDRFINGSVGSFNNSAYMATECAPGYTGNLCMVCEDGYGTSDYVTCKACPSNAQNIVYLTLSYVFSMLGMILALRSSLSDQGQTDDAATVTTLTPLASPAGTPRTPHERPSGPPSQAGTPRSPLWGHQAGPTSAGGTPRSHVAQPSPLSQQAKSSRHGNPLGEGSEHPAGNTEGQVSLPTSTIPSFKTSAVELPDQGKLELRSQQAVVEAGHMPGYMPSPSVASGADQARPKESPLTGRSSFKTRLPQLMTQAGGKSQAAQEGGGAAATGGSAATAAAVIREAEAAPASSEEGQKVQEGSGSKAEDSPRGGGSTGPGGKGVTSVAGPGKAAGEGKEEQGEEEASEETEETEEEEEECLLTAQHDIDRPQSASIMKILVSYLQVISMVRNIPLDFPVPFANLLSIYNTATSMPGAAASLDCSLPPSSSMSISRAAVKVLLGVASPLYVYIIFTVFWVLRMSYLTLRGRMPDAPATYMRIRLIVTLGIVFFYLYPSVTTALLSIFSCQSIDNTDTRNVLAVDTGLQTGSYWQLDMNQQCYKGYHFILTVAVGIPGLVLFALGVPACLAWFLIANRSKLGRPQFFSLYNFLYAEYHTWACWYESVIMVRKLAVAAVVVFLLNTELGVQMLSTIAVIVAALAIQMVLHPYGGLHVDSLERLSLYTTLATLYIALFFMFDSVSLTARNALGVLLILLNVIVVAIFVWRLLAEYRKAALRAVGLKASQLPHLDRQDLLEQLSAKFKPRTAKVLAGIVHNMHRAEVRVSGVFSRGSNSASAAAAAAAVADADSQAAAGKLTSAPSGKGSMTRAATANTKPAAAAPGIATATVDVVRGVKAAGQGGGSKREGAGGGQDHAAGSAPSSQSAGDSGSFGSARQGRGGGGRTSPSRVTPQPPA